MRPLTAFIQLTTDGYFTDAHDDLSWAYGASNDAEFQEFVKGNTKGESTLVLGRKTYDMMARHWPTPAAQHAAPEVAAKMNNAEKIVISRTLETATWNNTTVLRGDLFSEIRALKQANGAPLVILGSGSIVAQLSQAKLIDEYQIVTVPIALGSGRTIFDGLSARLPLVRTNVRVFNNGNVFTCYAPA